MTAADPEAFAPFAGVYRSQDSYYVWCDCGYMIGGWPTLAIAQADADAHNARGHAPLAESVRPG